MRRRRIASLKTWVLSSLAAGSLLSPAAPAAADTPSNPAKADALFNAAKARMAKRDYVPACAELSESERLDPQVGTALNLAYCYERIGRTATAWSVWLQAAAAAATRGDRAREDFAAQRAHLLEGQLLRITIAITPQPARERIRLAVDDVPLTETTWGSSLPLDPGEHEIVGLADGYRPWRQRFTVARDLESTIVVPVLAPSVADELASRPTSTAASAWPAVIWTTGTVGVVTLGVGAAFGIAFLVNKNDAQDNCARSGCNPIALADYARARDDGLVAEIAYGVGGAAVIASAALYLGFRSGSFTPGGSWTASVQPTQGGGAAVDLTGRW